MRDWGLSSLVGMENLQKEDEIEDLMNLQACLLICNKWPMIQGHHIGKTDTLQTTNLNSPTACSISHSFIFVIDLNLKGAEYFFFLVFYNCKKTIYLT